MCNSTFDDGADALQLAIAALESALQIGRCVIHHLVEKERPIADNRRQACRPIMLSAEVCESHHLRLDDGGRASACMADRLGE